MAEPTSNPGTDLGGATLYTMNEVATEQMSPTLTRQYVSGSQTMFARILLKKGCVVPEHSHPNEQLAIIVSGKIEFTVAGVSRVLGQGEVLVIPGGVPHAATALEDTEDWDIFSPPRQDWIDGDDSYLRQR
jgi:quercetin dioxygenase-like cupin family protein